MSDFRVYKTLLFTMSSDMFNTLKLRMGFRGEKKKKNDTPLSLDNRGSGLSISSGTKKFLSKLLGVFAVLILLFYVVTMTVVISQQFIGGNESNFVYIALLASQIAILFMGGSSTLSLFYFGRDNELILSLPVKNTVVYAVKLTMAYFSELVISAFVALPMLVTFGITSSLSGGVVFGASYYIFSVISVFLLPILPLLVISILVIPTMYFISFFKNRELGKSIVSTFLALCIAALYLAVAFSINFFTETDDMGNSVMNPALGAALNGMAKFGIYNHSIVQAILGNNPAPNFFIYLGGLVVILVLVVAISGLFYRKGMSVIIEGSSSTRKKKSIEDKDYKKSSLLSAFIKKEVMMVLSSPQVLLGYVISLLVIPFMCFVQLSEPFVLLEEGETPTLADELFFVSLLSYLGSMFTWASNVLSTVAFSLEGKNIKILKSLPIKPKDILNGKLIAGLIISSVIILETTVCYVAMSRYHNVFIGIGLFFTLVISGLSSSFVCLYRDIKNPNFNFTNVNQLTNNNTRMLKPMLFNALFSMLHLVLGIVLMIFSEVIGIAVAYVVYFVGVAVANGLVALVGGKKLYGRIDEFFDNIEV